MESCANRAFLETVNSESTVCGPSEDHPGDEDLVQLKECTRAVRAHLANFVFSAKKNRRSSINLSFLFKLQ